MDCPGSVGYAGESEEERACRIAWYNEATDALTEYAEGKITADELADKLTTASENYKNCVAGL